MLALADTICLVHIASGLEPFWIDTPLLPCCLAALHCIALHCTHRYESAVIRIYVNKQNSQNKHFQQTLITNTQNDPFVLVGRYIVLFLDVVRSSQPLVEVVFRREEFAFSIFIVFAVLVAVDAHGTAVGDQLAWYGLE